MKPAALREAVGIKSRIHFNRYYLAQSDMENCQAFKEELQSDRNRVFRLVTGGTGA